jgi:ankyrin repeat protein
LCNTQQTLEIFLFLLQVCQHLFIAAKYGDANTVKILFNYTNDNCTGDFILRDPPLVYAAIFGHEEVVRAFLEGGANVESANAYHSTALHQAAWNGYRDVCRLLLDWGAKVDPLDEWKETPLHLAAWAGHLSVVQLLVERGADVRVKNDFGQTASEVARSEGKEDVVEFLNSESVGKDS